MSEESERFRNRAKQCRTLARDARDDFQRDTLNSMADDLDAEAERLEAEETGEG